MSEPHLSAPAPLGAVTIRGLAPDLKARLRVRAAYNARSMEAEARAILEAALAAPEEDPTDLAAFARGLFAPLGGVELELPPREPARDPPGFGEEARPAPSPNRASSEVGVRPAGSVEPKASPARPRRGR
jgi:plasmid stability protein